MPATCNCLARLDDTKDFCKVNCKWSSKSPGQQPKNGIRSISKNKYISLSLDNTLYEYIKRQALHKGVELGRVVEPNEMIRSALQVAFPEPKQYDMFGDKR